MRRILLSIFCSAGAGISMAAADGPIVFLKDGTELYLTDVNAPNPRRLDHDPRPKWNLRWDGHRKRISYLVPGEHGESGEKARIVEIDTDGNQVMDTSIERDELIRSVDGFDWLPDGTARISGSVNPRNCLQHDLDPETGKISNAVEGKCGSFVRSPDNKHTAELGVIPQTDDAHRFDTVDFDSPPDYQPAAYGGGGYDVFIPAGPVWSPDSKAVVFLEKRADTGEAAVVFLSLARVVTRVPVPAFILESPAIAWVGSKVIAGEGGTAIQIDPVTKQISAVTADNSDEIARKVTAKRTAEAARMNVEDVVKRLGGREGILLDPEAMK